MLRRTMGPALALLVPTALLAATVGVADGAPAPAAHTQATAAAADKTGDRPHAGPPYNFTTELMGDRRFIFLKDRVMLNRTKLGYRFRSGGEDNHLTVTRVKGGLKFRDTGTKRFKHLFHRCHRLRVNPGIGAICPVGKQITERRPMLVELWPRLGNDFTDTRTLPATFAVTVLGDEGRDVSYFGAGDDFFNGHSPRDKVFGGAGADWIRAGLGNDLVIGGPGNDDLVAMQGRDVVRAGPGNDRVGGAEGSDRLWGNAGADFLLCGTARDSVWADRADRIFHDCENVNH